MNKKLYIVFLFIGAIFVLYSFASTNSYLGRFFKWRASDIEDVNKFPKHEFKASSQPYFFIKSSKKYLDSLKFSHGKNRSSYLYEILKNSGTTAFIVIRNDTLIYEKYLNDYYRNSINTSFSVAKSITSLITGITIDEQYITSVNDPVTKYIPEMIKTDSRYKELRISQLMDMRSGMQFKDHDLPWGDKPKAYYYPDLRKRILELPLESNPGGGFKYNSYNPILLGMIIEKASQMSPAKYFEMKLWNQMGMEYSGSWSMDSEASGMTKMESGLNIRAIDMAKFGRLILNNGNWNGKQLISTEWLDYSFGISEKYKLTDYADNLYYRNFWWIYAEKNKFSYQISCIAGTGHLGQYLFIFPKEKTIIVRMGKADKKVDSWKTLFYDIVESIN